MSSCTLGREMCQWFGASCLKIVVNVIEDLQSLKHGHYSCSTCSENGYNSTNDSQTP